ncbi:MAG TPA: hypothetical protein PKA60_01145 [Candidatus Paceibacterota bacterium]|nr:hypothetical protein [Candidatus Paceibacterota bacterium]
MEKNENEEIRFKKQNPILLIISNILKFILAEYHFYSKEPELNFKNLSSVELVLELNKHKNNARKILFKKHSRLVKKIGKKWTELSDTHDYTSGNDIILKYLIENGWREDAARSNLEWLLSKSFATLSLHQFKRSLTETENLLVEGKVNKEIIDAILEELVFDDLFFISFSINKGIRFYL